MFGIGWSEILLTVIVALVVIGPKDLPGALYSLGKMSRKGYAFSRSFRKAFDDLMKEAELEDIVKQANAVGSENIQFELEKQIALEDARKQAVPQTEKTRASGS